MRWFHTGFLYQYLLLNYISRYIACPYQHLTFQRHLRKRWFIRVHFLISYFHLPAQDITHSLVILQKNKRAFLQKFMNKISQLPFFWPIFAIFAFFCRFLWIICELFSPERNEKCQFCNRMQYQSRSAESIFAFPYRNNSCMYKENEIKKQPALNRLFFMYL